MAQTSLSAVFLCRSRVVLLSEQHVVLNIKDVSEDVVQVDYRVGYNKIDSLLTIVVMFFHDEASKTSPVVSLLCRSRVVVMKLQWSETIIIVIQFHQIILDCRVVHLKINLLLIDFLLLLSSSLMQQTKNQIFL